MLLDISDIFNDFLKKHKGRNDHFEKIQNLLEAFLIAYKSTHGIKNSLEESLEKLSDLKEKCVAILEEATHSQDDAFTQESFRHIIHYLNALNLKEMIHDQHVTKKMERTLKQSHIEHLLSITADWRFFPDASSVGRILLLISNESTLSLISKQLTDEGHTLFIAKSENEALAFLNKEKIDILMIDDGHMSSFVSDIRSFCSNESTYVHVIFLESHEKDANRLHETLTKGIDDYYILSSHVSLLRPRLQSAFLKLFAHRSRQHKLQDYKKAMEDLENVMNNLEDAFLFLDDNNKITNHNNVLFALFPYLKREYHVSTKESLIGESFLTLLEKNAQHHIYDSVLQKTSKTHVDDIKQKLLEESCEWQEKLANGHILNYRMQKTNEGDKIIIIKDNSVTALGTHHLAYMAYYDSLTGTVNRSFFTQRLEHMMLDQHNRLPLALLIIDLDCFKAVNDQHGHEMGDWLLKQVAQRLKSCVREGDIVARFGGDEFTILLRNLVNIETIRAITERIIAVVCADYRRGDTTLTIGASIGIACYPSDCESPNDLINRADTAMYNIKQHGKNGYRFYSELILPKNSVVH